MSAANNIRTIADMAASERLGLLAFRLREIAFTVQHYDPDELDFDAIRRVLVDDRARWPDAVPHVDLVVEIIDDIVAQLS